MTDTSPEIELMVRQKMMARTGAERMIIGAEMFEAAKIMVCASFPAGLAESERKRRLFVRLYGNDELARKLWPATAAGEAVEENQAPEKIHIFQVAN